LPNKSKFRLSKGVDSQPPPISDLEKSLRPKATKRKPSRVDIRDPSAGLSPHLACARITLVDRPISPEAPSQLEAVNDQGIVGLHGSDILQDRLTDSIFVEVSGFALQYDLERQTESGFLIYSDRTSNTM
jgi:hypothetical protein